MNDMILILNYSDEFSIEIARRLRAEQVYSRIVPGCISAQAIAAIAPRGVILSGEAAGSNAAFDTEIAGLDIPVLALGHAAHLLLGGMGGASAGAAVSGKKAYIRYGECALFAGVSGGERYLEEALTLMLPADVQEIAEAAGCSIAFADEQKKHYGVQFELERNDPEGSAIIKNFARDICGCSAWWSLDAAIEQAERVLEEAAGKGGHALCAVSGGVDSTVAAILAHRAFGDRMTAVFVDTGLMREGEADDVKALFEAHGVPLVCVDRSAEILEKLAGVRGNEEKRNVVTGMMHGEMIRMCAQHEGRTTLVLGTNYSDFLHSGSSSVSWSESGMDVAEPLLELFKEEVREMALHIGVNEQVAARKPFPALGLGARIVGEITAQRLHAMRAAERIFSEEICEAGLERKLYKYFPVLFASEGGSGGEMMILRAVTLSGSQLMPARLPYDLVERTVQRIMAQSRAVKRVFYDQTPTQVGKESFS